MNLAFIFDLDGTTYDNSHRAHLVSKEVNNTPSWTAFNLACIDDTPRAAMIELMKTLMYAHRDVRILTGRGHAAHGNTVTRLAEDLKVSRTLTPPIIMRPMESRQCAADFKRDVMLKLLSDHPLTEFIMFEDDPTVVEACRKLERVTVLQIDTACAAVKASA